MARIIMYILPSWLWKAKGEDTSASSSSVLTQLLRESIDLRRRISKGANLSAERMRYTLCLTEIENQIIRLDSTLVPAEVASIKATLAAAQIPAVLLPNYYFDLLARAHAERLNQRTLLPSEEKQQFRKVDTESPGLGSSIFPPQVISSHLEELQSYRESPTLHDHPQLLQTLDQRVQIVQLIAQSKLGFVEISEELDNEVPSPPLARPAVSDSPPATPVPLEPAEPTRVKGRRKMVENLIQDIETALPGRGKVNMSNQPHEISTEVLGQFLYESPLQPAGQVRIIYADGSEAKPFPLRSLPQLESSHSPTVEISVALMSMRHLELDPIVDWSWYRNKEVSQTRPLADSDEFCFQYSLTQLEELKQAYAGERVLLKMYHTGFEPAAIGFYRAVMTMLMKHRGWLQVVPHYYRGGSHFQVSDTVWH